MTEDTPHEVDVSEDQPSKTSGWGQLAAWVLVLGLLGVVGVQLQKGLQGTAASGQAAPNFILTTFEGEEYALADLRGKVVVLNFWASWCKPCEQEAADLQAAWEIYEPSGNVIFLGADYVDTELEAAKYLEKWQITYPNGPDYQTRISQAFRIRGVPETYIIDKEGNISFVKIGPFLTLEEITAAIESVLNKAPAAE